MGRRYIESEGRWFKSPDPSAACQSVLEQHTEPQIAPETIQKLLLLLFLTLLSS